jgi:hypothetical protein
MLIAHAIQLINKRKRITNHVICILSEHNLVDTSLHSWNIIMALMKLPCRSSPPSTIPVPQGCVDGISNSVSQRSKIVARDKVHDHD